MPIASVNGLNYYSVGLRSNLSNVTSLEDPFVFDASSSISVINGEEGASYRFILSKGGVEVFSQDSGDSLLKYPYNYNISDIKGKIFSGVGDYVLELYVFDNVNFSWGTSRTFQDLRVAECIPYRNNSHPYPYPYHNNRSGGGYYSVGDPGYLSDPFKANHTCCLGDLNNFSSWRLADSSVRCSPPGEPDIRCGFGRGNACLGVPYVPPPPRVCLLYSFGHCWLWSY